MLAPVATAPGCSVVVGAREGCGARGCSSMAEHQLPKLTVRVRFPSPAPSIHPSAPLRLFPSYQTRPCRLPCSCGRRANAPSLSPGRERRGTPQMMRRLGAGLVVALGVGVLAGLVARGFMRLVTLAAGE